MFDNEVNMEISITINERITDLRTMSGLSQKELADKIDVPTSTLCRIEQGKVDALDEAETLMFYELSKHLLERMSGGCD